MNETAKQAWERIASAAQQDEGTRKMLESFDLLDNSIKSKDWDNEDSGFRLPYSSRPKAINGTWK